MSASLLRRAAEWSVARLRAAADRDLGAPAADLTWSCRETAAHVADVLFSYACQVVRPGATGWLPLKAVTEASATGAELADGIGASARLLAAAVERADAADRCWHPLGLTDPAGYAALGALEVLAHTEDVLRGLGAAGDPPADLAAGVVERLFPAAPPGPPVAVLRWCTGRADLPGRPRPREWRPVVAPDDPRADRARECREGSLA